MACRSKGAELNSYPLRQRDHAGAAGTPRRKSCMFCVCRRIWYGQVCRYHGRLSHNRPPRPLVTPSAPKGLQCNPAGFAPQVCTTVVRNVIRSTWFEGCVRTLFSSGRTLISHAALPPADSPPSACVKLQTAHPANPGLHSVATGVSRLRPPHRLIARKDPLNFGGGQMSSI